MTQRVEHGLQALSAYVVPFGFALLALWAWWAWPSEYRVGLGRTLVFQALPANESLSPAQVVAALSVQPTRSEWDTNLSERPLWLLIHLDEENRAAGRVIDFPSRHAQSMRCWDGASLQALGAIERLGPSSGQLQASRAGFALVAQPLPATVLCEARFTGPARFTAIGRHIDELTQLERQFHRNAGWLDGGLLLLALFTLVAGIINRERNYLIFAAWLVVNQRMAALSAGWDYQWLGHLIAPQWLTTVRQWTLALYATTTVVLFRSLFAEDLERTQTLRPVQWVVLACVPVLVAAAVLPYAAFLPLIWVATALGMCVLVYALGVILLRTRSRVAVWYAASMAIALFASLAEVVAAALGLKQLLGAVNSVTAALASSLLASLAIAEQFRQEHERRLALQAELQHTFDFIPIGLFTLDLKGQFLSANPALLGILGRPVEVGLDRWEDIFQQTDWSPLTQDASRSDHRAPMEFEARLRRPGGVDRRFLVRAARAGDKIEGALQDITDKVRAHEHLQFLADHDPLTKVMNRRGIEACLSRGLQRLRRGQPLAVAYLDLDRFKLINDLYGHLAGDAVLQQVCQRVQGLLEPHIYLGRIGGDEFLIILYDTTLHRAEAVCRDILAALDQAPYQVGERAFQVHGSIGLVEVAPGTSVKDVIATADRACREAKRAHATSLVVYEVGSAAVKEHAFELQLVQQLATGQDVQGLFLEMQPIVSLRHPGQSLNFEVLLRMRDERGERISTERLIRAAENAGRMGAIDRWVITTTLQWLQQHQSVLPPNQFVCINLNGASLNDERFIADVFAILDAHGDVAHRLCLEITESVALHDLDNTRRFIERIRSRNAKVALDDFGAGYTSFSYLRDLPADVLKIDGSFIVDMNRHPANVAIVEAIVTLAQHLGMKTIAEWAEDVETVETLAEIGVDYVQGYAVSRAVAPERLLEARSGADFITDSRLRDYLSTLPSDDELAHVDWVLGSEGGPAHQAAGSSLSSRMSG